MTSRNLLLASTLVLITFSSVWGQEERPPADLAAVTASLRSGWERLQTLMPSLQVDCETSFYAGGPGTPLSVRGEHRWRSRGQDSYLQVMQSTAVGSNDAKGMADTVTAFNPNYVFDLRRTIGEQNWRLNTAQPLTPELTQKPDYVTPQQMRDWAVPWLHFRAPDKQLLHELFEDSRFKLTGVGASPVNASWVRVSGTRSGQEADRKKNIHFEPSLVGWFDIDMELGCCRGLESTRDYKGTKITDSCIFEVERHSSGVALLKKDNYESRSESKGKTRHDGYSETSYTYTVNARVPESEFTLSAFGLPEPYFAPQPRSWVWVYLAGGAGAAVLAGWWLRQRTRTRGA